MDASPAAPQPHRMLQMQHLMIDDVVHRIARHLRVIEDLADYNGVVSGIVMAKAVARALPAPCHLGPGEESAKEAEVQFIEQNFQIIGMALGLRDALAPADLPHQVRLGGDVVT
jgi:hypothetical protein